jgi:hypothetical protein
MNFNVDLSLSEYPCLQPGLKVTARLKQVSQTLALPEDTAAYLLEILKFLGTLGLILVTALIMLMTG